MMLSDNIWWTKKSRIQAEKRLLSNAFQAQILLLWYSFCSVAFAIYYLKFNTDSEYAAISWVVFSVLVLSISGFINALGFKERAALIKDSYETLSDLYQRAKEKEKEKEKEKPKNTDEISDEYRKILNVCENHADVDYHFALCDSYLSSNDISKLDKHPTRYIWILVAYYYFKRILMFCVLYALPIILFSVMEYCNVSKGTV